MNKQCECCLSPNNLMELTDIHVNLIVSCFSVEVSSICTFDKSSNYICNICAAKINDCFTFRSQILISQIKLKKKYTSTINDNMNFEPSKSVPEPDPLKQELLSDCDDTHDFDDSIYKTSMSPEETLDFQMDPDSDSNEPLINKTQIKLSKYDTMPDSNNSSIEKRSTRSQRNWTLPSHHEVELDLNNIKNSIQKEETLEFDNVREPNPSNSDETALTCVECNRTFTTHNQLSAHIRLQHKFVCDMCGKDFKLKKFLTHHMRVHLDYSRCTICGKFIKPSYMARHVKSHSGNAVSFKCSICSEVLATQSLRYKHMISVHKVDVRKHCCESCPKKFFSPKKLKDHIGKRHLKQLNAACDVCGLKFFDMREVKLHMIAHSEEKKFSCPFCDKKFKRNGHLKDHLPVHDEGKLKCTHCDSVFSNRNGFMKHLRTKHA